MGGSPSLCNKVTLSVGAGIFARLFFSGDTIQRQTDSLRLAISFSAGIDPEVGTATASFPTLGRAIN